MDKNSVKKREKNFELLSIISIIMIVILLFNGHGQIMSNVKIGSIEYFITYFLEYGCIIAVNIYVMITGYYMIKSKIKINKLIKLELEIIFYSVIIYLTLILLNRGNFNISTMIKSCFPILTKQYWFMSAYMGLYILIPFINKLVRNINKKEYMILLIILTTLLSVIKTAYNKNDVFEANGGYGLFWFIYLYLLAGYIRLHFNKKIKNSILFVTYISMIVLQMLIRYIYTKTNIIIISSYVKISLQYNSFFILVETVSVFLLFKDMRIKSNIANKVIEKIAPLTLGVYLIHEQPIFRNVLWNEMLKPFYYLNTGVNITIILILDVAIIFITCCVIEELRIILFKLFGRIKIIKYLNRKIEKHQININI